MSEQAVDINAAGSDESATESAPPRPVVICGPSGVGKGTLIELLQKRFSQPNSSSPEEKDAQSDKFGFSVSHTTRKPREGEVNGVHYHFTSVDQIKEDIDQGKFVEYAEVHGNYYGTSVEAVKSVQNEGKICLLDIDIQGVQTVKQTASHLQPIYIFIAPPSMEELESRLRGRGTESESDIERRLNNAKNEMEYGTKEGNFDVIFVNKDLDETLEEMAQKFMEWFPVLLGETMTPVGPPQAKDETSNKSADESKEEESTEEPKEEPAVEEPAEDQTPDKTENEQEASEEEQLPPNNIDPLSFPQTDEGLKALLSELDQECPFDEYVQPKFTYRASNVIGAGKKLDIPLPPVQQDGSRIQWTITLVDEHQEGLDVEFGLVVIVDGEEVIAREMGRILSPSPYLKDKKGPNNKERRETETTASDNETVASSDEEEPSAKGKFTVANSAPVTIVIKLNNSYSWLTPKKVKYSFTIIPPVDENMIARSQRARSLLPRIEEEKKAAEAMKKKENERAEALDRIKAEMEGKLTMVGKQMEEERKNIDTLIKRSEELESEAETREKEISDTLLKIAKEDNSLEEVTAAIHALEDELAKLKKKLEELNIEKQVRMEEKANFENEVDAKKLDIAKLEEQASSQKQMAESKEEEIENLEKDLVLVQDNLSALEKERHARKEEIDKFTSQIEFFQKQVDAVQLRIMEPNT